MSASALVTSCLTEGSSIETPVVCHAIVPLSEFRAAACGPPAWAMRLYPVAESLSGTLVVSVNPVPAVTTAAASAISSATQAVTTIVRRLKHQWASDDKVLPFLHARNVEMFDAAPQDSPQFVLCNRPGAVIRTTADAVVLPGPRRTNRWTT
jgi:hypothetical protein